MSKRISETELKEIQLGILKYVHQFCKENNISYFLCAGTLIGAVRHQGYIPWDDDIDICMLREDYEKFFSLQYKACTKDKTLQYRPAFHGDNGHYYRAFGKMFDNRTLLVEKINYPAEIGVNIDIFPLDKVPIEKKERRRIIRRIKYYQKLLALKQIRIEKDRSFLKNCVLWAAQLVLKPCSLEKISSLITRTATSYNNHLDHDYLLLDMDMLRYGDDKVYLPEDFSDTVQLPFEGGFYNCPVGYDRALRAIYGDYMRLPPEEKRIAHHDFDAFWK